MLLCSFLLTYSIWLKSRCYNGITFELRPLIIVSWAKHLTKSNTFKVFLGKTQVYWAYLRDDVEPGNQAEHRYTVTLTLSPLILCALSV